MHKPSLVLSAVALLSYGTSAQQPSNPPLTLVCKLLLGDLHDALLDGAGHVQALDSHAACLAHAPGAPHRLLLQRPVEARLHDEHVTGCGEVDAHSAAAHGDEEHRGGRVLLEGVDGAGALRLGHAAADGAVLEALCRQPGRGGGGGGARPGQPPGQLGGCDG
jgi:hypothetical protein